MSYLKLAKIKNIENNICWWWLSSPYFLWVILLNAEKLRGFVQPHALATRRSAITNAWTRTPTGSCRISLLPRTTTSGLAWIRRLLTCFRWWVFQEMSLDAYGENIVGSHWYREIAVIRSLKNRYHRTKHIIIQNMESHLHRTVFDNHLYISWA